MFAVQFNSLTLTSTKSLLQENGIKIIQNQSHIVSIFIGDSALSKKISKSLLEHYRIYVQNINYPTVPKGKEMLRIIVTPNHSSQMIENLVVALKSVMASNGLI